MAVLAMVTRLVGHKGIDLLCYIAERLLQRRVQLVIIGTGEEKYEWYLNTLRDRFGDKVSVNLLFDGGVAPSRSSTPRADSRIRSGPTTKRMRPAAALPSRATTPTISSPRSTARSPVTTTSLKNGCGWRRTTWPSIRAGTSRPRNTWRCSRTSAASNKTIS